jgi:hypothetical protein
MIYHGWMDITNVDYSNVVIEQSKLKFVALYRQSVIGVIVDSWSHLLISYQNSAIKVWRLLLQEPAQLYST